MSRNGVTSVVLNLLNNIDTTRHDIVLISARKIDEWFIDIVKKNNVRCIQMKHPRKKILDYVIELKKILISEKPNIIHVHGNSATMYLEIAVAKKVGVPVRIAHSHNSAGQNQTIHRILRPLLVNAMTHGIGCSDLAQKFAFKNSSKSFILNNGIITERFAYNASVRSAVKEREHWNSTFIIGHVGNFVPAKNHEFLLRIAKKLKENSSHQYKFLLFGKGPLEEKIQASIGENDLTDSVLLLGSRSDIDQFYQAMDLFILPSNFEGFPMVLVEAQTSGLPCLISDNVSKTTDLINKAKYLPIDSPNAVELWANEIEKAMNAPLLDRSSAKDIIDQKGYSAKSSAEKLMQIYNGEIL